MDNNVYKDEWSLGMVSFTRRPIMRKHSFIPACGPLEDRVMLSATPTYTLKALSDTTVQVSWTKVPGAAGYWVDMYKGSWITIAKLGSTATS